MIVFNAFALSTLQPKWIKVLPFIMDRREILHLHKCRFAAGKQSKAGLPDPKII